MAGTAVDARHVAAIGHADAHGARGDPLDLRLDGWHGGEAADLVVA
jgi:hypothetical protein